MFSALIRTLKFFRSPQLARIWAEEFIEDRINTPLHRKHVNYYAINKLPIKQGIAKVTGLEDTDVEPYFKNLPKFLSDQNKDPGMSIRWSSTSELATTTYIIVRLLKPKIVVETGIGAGVSSWIILHAMQQNGIGKLVSIDLPTPNTQLLPSVGYLVPRNLHHRWDIRTGSSRELLLPLLSKLSKIDIFQHDSRHSYKNQLQEYLTAWPFIRDKGILISDDVNNDALHDASKKWNQDLTIIDQNKESPIGLVRKV